MTPIISKPLQVSYPLENEEVEQDEEVDEEDVQVEGEESEVDSLDPEWKNELMTKIGPVMMMTRLHLMAKSITRHLEGHEGTVMRDTRILIFQEYRIPSMMEEELF